MNPYSLASESENEHKRRAARTWARILLLAGWAVFIGTAAADAFFRNVPWREELFALGAGPVMMLAGAILNRRAMGLR